MSRAASVTAAWSADPARRFLGKQGLEPPLEVLPYQSVCLAGELPALQPFVERRDQHEVGLAEIRVGRWRALRGRERDGRDLRRLARGRSGLARGGLRRSCSTRRLARASAP